MKDTDDLDVWVDADPLGDTPEHRAFALGKATGLREAYDPANDRNDLLHPWHRGFEKGLAMGRAEGAREEREAAGQRQAERQAEEVGIVEYWLGEIGPAESEGCSIEHALRRVREPLLKRIEKLEESIETWGDVTLKNLEYIDALDALVDDLDRLLVCYRVGRRPSDALLARITAGKSARKKWQQRAKGPRRYQRDDL